LLLLGGCAGTPRGDDDTGDDDTGDDDTGDDDTGDDDTGDDDDSSGQDDDDATAPASEPCNGHVELCGRAFDQVALPATHNSMANAADSWWVPNQSVGINQQLADGIRGLLLDTFYWNDDLYLCHADCNLGNTLLADALAGIVAFLEANPREVLVLLLQDGVSAADTAASFSASGLSSYVHTQYDGEPWPTLAEMIASGGRVVVTAEVEGPPPPWYHHAWDLYSDTPYSFFSVGSFNCDLNRGQADNDLFLVNHWFSNPLSSSSNADTANAYSVLSQRVAECQSERGQIPNLVAVDFYDRGDLFRVVDELNGVAR
jgi:hypothetical protein